MTLNLRLGTYVDDAHKPKSHQAVGEAYTYICSLYLCTSGDRNLYVCVNQERWHLQYHHESTYVVINQHTYVLLQLTPVVYGRCRENDHFQVHVTGGASRCLQTMKASSSRRFGFKIGLFIISGIDGAGAQHCDVMDKNGRARCPLGLVMITANRNFVYCNVSEG